jgi:putative hydrolase of HD superfamily
MAYLVKDEFPEADINKVILMCICHDLGEAITGDIPSFNKTESDENIENEEVHQLLSTLPEPYKKELSMLFIEMHSQKTIESKIYKALDKLEAIIQHNEADISTWIPLEYELNLTYGEKEVEFSSYLKELRQTINEDTINKIQCSKKSIS